MNHFQHMTAMALASRSRPAAFVRKDSPCGGDAAMGNAQQYGPSFAPGGAT